ncbi:MAG: cytochrome c [Fibrobacteria bacterium]
MNLLILGPVLLVLIGLRFLKPPILVWMGAWWSGFFLVLNYALTPPLPSSIIGLYLAVLTAVLLIYLSADSGRLRTASLALLRFFTERRFAPLLWTLAAIIPLLAGYAAYRDASREVAAPANARTIHPAPPGEMDFKGKKINLLTASNPFRELEDKDAAAFDAHVADGRKVYYRNCVFCHGDNLKGDGIHSHGFDPLPANFQDPTTIAMLQESYLFWRIAKGGPGLPEESTPWASAMPAWEKFLSEDEIWDVILFLYRFTGQKPRAQERAE